MNAFELWASILLDTRDYESSLNDASSKTNSFADKLKTGLATAGKVAAAGLAAATTAVGAFAKSAVSTGMEFDSAMSQVAATMGVTVDDVQELRDFAKEMGSSTAFSASQAAEALNYMALAGYDANQSMEALPNVLNLAAAGGIELAAASDMVTDAQSALGLSMEESAALVDKMAKASSKSNTSVAQLGEAILTVGGTAKSLAGGTTELSTVLGILADNGIKSAEGGTHLRNIMLSLQSPTDKAAKLLNTLGIEVYDAEGNMRPLSDTIQDFNAAMDGMTDAEKNDIITNIFNTTDLAAVDALLSTTTERWDELTEAIGNADGAAAQMAETQLDNLAGDITLFQSALEGAQIVLSEKLAPSLREFVQFGSESLSSLSNAFEEGGLEGLFETFESVLSEGLAMIIDGLPEAVNAGAQLLGAVVSGVASALPALLDAAAEIVVSFANYLAENAGEIVSGADELMTALFQAMIEAVPTVAEGLFSALTSLFGDLTPVITGAATAVGVFAAALNFSSIVSAVTGVLSSLKIAVVAVNAAMLANPFVLVVALIAGLVTAVITLWNTNEDFRNTIIGIWEAIKEKVGKAVEAIKEFFTGLGDKISDMIDIGGKLLEGLWQGIQDKVKWLKEKVGGVVDTIKGWFTGKDGFDEHSPSKWAEKVGAYVSEGLANGIEKEATEAEKAAETMAKNIYTGLKEWADKTTKYEELSLREQLSMWQAIQAQFLADSEQYTAAEEQIFDLHQQILQENLDLEEEYQKKFSDISEKIFDSYGLFDEVPKAEEVSGKELIKNLEDQIDSIENFYNMLEELYERGVGEDLVNEIKEMGVGAADELTALLELSDKKLSQYADLFYEKQKLANDLATDELSDLRQSTNQEIAANLSAISNLYTEEAPIAGEKLPQGLAEGIANGTSELVTAAEEMATAAVDKVKEVLQIHSPSKVFYGIGENMALGLVQGWESDIPALNNSISGGINIPTETVEASSVSSSESAIIGKLEEQNSVLRQLIQLLGSNQSNINVALELDGSTLARKMYSYTQNETNRRGTSLISTT